jgi:hypothetical protein
VDEESGSDCTLIDRIDLDNDPPNDPEDPYDPEDAYDPNDPNNSMIPKIWK